MLARVGPCRAGGGPTHTRVGALAEFRLITMLPRSVCCIHSWRITRLSGWLQPALRLVSRLQSNTRAIDVWGSGVVSLPSLVRVSHAAGPGVIVDQVARYLGWLRHAWPLSAESRVVRCRTTAGLQRCGATAGTEALWIVPRWQWVQPDMHGHSNLCPGLKQALR